MSGHQGGPGRPKGKRNYLTEVVLQAFGDDFALYGKSEPYKTGPRNSQ